MIKNMYEQNIILYVIAGFGGLGLLVRFVTALSYRLLLSASDNMGNSKQKLMRHLKMKFETCYKLKIGVHNVDIFVDKYVYKYRFCGILLSTWDNLCGQTMVLSILLGLISVGTGIIYECGKETILYTFFLGFAICTILMIVESMINIPVKRDRIKVNIKHYMENYLKIRLEQEYINAEELEAYRREYFAPEPEVSEEVNPFADIVSSAAQNSKTELAANLEPTNQKKSSKKTEIAQKKALKTDLRQEKIIQEILTEYLP